MKGLAFAFFALTAVTGCTDDYSVVVTANKPSDTACAAGSGDTLGLVRGTLDVTSPLPDGTLNSGYALTPLVESALSRPSTSGSNIGNPNGHIAYVHGADVEIISDGTDASDRLVTALKAAGAAKRKERFTVAILPGGSAGMAFLVLDAVQTQILSAAITGEELATIITRSTLFGDLDSTSFKALPFDYPITVCKGCLIKDVGNCADFESSTEFEKGGICAPLQDKILSCCTLATGGKICPALGTKPDMGN